MTVAHSFLTQIREDYVNADRFIALCDHVFWQDSFGAKGSDNSFRAGQSVFCKIDRIWECFGRMVRSSRRVVLVTGQGDFPIDERRIGEAPANVAAWFGSNALSEDPRVHPLPLGLGSQDCSVTLRATDIAAGLESSPPRDKWLYVNFRPDTNRAVRAPIYAHFENLRGEDWVTFQRPSGHGDNFSYLDALMSHRFVLCPPGFGVDTHRMWESLYAQAIPVVLKSPAMRAFTDLPILFVDDYAELTLDRLQTEEQRIRSRSWNLDALFLPYWRDKVLTAQSAIKARPHLRISEWAPSFYRAFIRRFLK